MPPDTYCIVQVIGRYLSAPFLRGTALLLGAALCVWVLAGQGAALPWLEIAGLAAVRLLVQFRPVVLRRDSGGEPLLCHVPGGALAVVALLRHGPAASLAVTLLSGAAYHLWHGRDLLKDPLQKLSPLFYACGLNWIGGTLYFAFGGHFVQTAADSALFYQHPRALLLPLVGMLVLTNELIHRPFTALVLRASRGTPLRETLRDPMPSSFVYMEALCGALLVVQWTAWGWGAVPFTVLTNESLLLATRAYFTRMEAWREAESDPLTGLASRRGIETYLARQIARACEEPVTFAVLFLDADGLKAVNDRHGHAAGDALLSLIGECCRLHARASDLVGRRGGDEFLLILNGLERDEAEKVRERLQRAIADTLAVHPLFGGVAGASIGLSAFPADASDADTLIEMADQRMYADKRARRLARQLI